MWLVVLELRGPDQSFTMFCVGVVHSCRGVGIGKVVRNVLSVGLLVVFEVHVSLVVFTEWLSLLSVPFLVLDHA